MQTLLLLFVVGLLFNDVHGHGRTMRPINRSSVWRDPQFVHLNPPSNWKDDEHFCGGYVTQHFINGGRCGPCGDNWASTTPRPNENTGYYGRGIVVANYTVGQVVDIEIEVTAEHMGYFEFRLCPLSSPNAVESNECFAYVLQRSDGRGTQFPIDHGIGMYTSSVRLPTGVTCNRCVLQWHYRTGNWWGDCGDGTEALGCGPQEIFRSCSDISIN